MKYSLSLFFVLISLWVEAQTIKVADNISGEGIPGLYITNQARTLGTVTNEQGLADLRELQGQTLIFKNNQYKTIILSWVELQQLNFIVHLEENVLALTEVVVSASRWEQNAQEVPNQIVSVTADQIQFSNPVSTADLLANTGEIFVQKSQLGGGSPMIRGFAANSILLMVDGARMNNAIYRQGNLQNVINLDANALEGVEIILGPGSTVYGSDALGGVIDFHTKNPTLSLNKTRLEGSTMARFNTANQERTLHTDFSISGKKLGAFTSITGTQIGDLRAGKRKLNHFPAYLLRTQYIERLENSDIVRDNPKPWYQIGTAYKQLNILQKFRFQPTNNLGFQYSYHLSTTTDIPRYDQLNRRTNKGGTEGSLRNGNWYYGPQKWQMHHFKTTYDQANQFFSHARATISYQHYTESRNDRRLNDRFLNQQLEEVDMLTANVDFERANVANGDLQYGLEGIWNWVESNGSMLDVIANTTTKSTPRYADLGNSSTSGAAYIAYRKPLHETLRLNTGLRYTYYQLQSSFSDRFYNFPFSKINLKTSALSGNIGITYMPSRFKLSTLLSSGFRAPNIDDLTKIFDPGEVLVVPNARLKPEYSYNAELSAGFEPVNKFSTSVTTYISLLENAIVRSPFLFNGQDSVEYKGELRAVYALVNASKGLIAGSSIQVRYAPIKHFLIKTALTYTWGEDLDEHNRLRHVPPLFGQTLVRLSKQNWSVEAVADYQSAVAYDKLPPSEQDKLYLYGPEGTQAWYTLGLKAEYKYRQTLQFNAGLENILDRHYRTYSSGISAAGRNFYSSLRYYF